jgi:hypothetical protein
LQPLYTLVSTNTIADLLTNSFSLSDGERLQQLNIPCHHMFSTCRANQELNPSRVEYLRIMEQFNPEVNILVSYVRLLEQAVGSGPFPQAYLCGVQSQQQRKIYNIHLPFRDYVHPLRLK